MSDPSPGPTPIQPLVISAPFGNYVQPAGATPTLGTFTLMRRGGPWSRVWRVLSTVRYYPRLKAWVNRIGLRNPGIDWLVARTGRGAARVSDKLVSIHGFTGDEWYALLERMRAIRPLAMELNISCPNVGHLSWPSDLFDRAMATGVPVIVKLPPVHYSELADAAYEAGVRCFHCCNTLPNPGGGLSGKPLTALSIQCIGDLRRRWPDSDVTLIGGGGIYAPADMDEYARAGAAHVAMASKLMNPMYLLTHRPLRPFVERAHKLLPPR